MASSSARREDSWMKNESLRKSLINKVEEYEKKNKGDIIIRILRGGIVWHGTTCVSFINKVGLLFGGDGLVSRFDPDDPEENGVSSNNEEKVHFIGDRMLISGAGSSMWIKYFLDVLTPEIESKNPMAVDHWNCKRCAEFVRSSQALGSDYVEKLYKLPPGSLKGKDCSMMFGAYENNEAKLFLGSESCVEEILDSDVYHKMQDQNEKQRVSVASIGSGRKIAERTVSDDNDTNIYGGDLDLSHVEDQLGLLLSAMLDSCIENIHTGGTILVYYMPPPPGVAHIIYNEVYWKIPVDILMFKTNMYRRLYESAKEAGSLMAAGYRERFIHFSDLYETALEEQIDFTRNIVASQNMVLQEQDQQLVNLSRRTSELKWFGPKWFKLCSQPSNA